MILLCSRDGFFFFFVIFGVEDIRFVGCGTGGVVVCVYIKKER